MSITLEYLGFGEKFLRIYQVLSKGNSIIDVSLQESILRLKISKVMKPYKVKHIPTGLYYQPSKGGNNLSPRGKIYQTSTNPINMGGRDYIGLSARDNSIVYRQTKDIIPWQKATWSYREMYYHAPKSDFQIEELC